MMVLWEDGLTSPRKEPTVPAVSIRPSIGAAEYPALVAIWRGAVDATHEFLAEADREEIEARLQSDYFPAVVGTAVTYSCSRPDRPERLAGVVPLVREACRLRSRCRWQPRVDGRPTCRYRPSFRICSIATSLSFMIPRQNWKTFAH